MQNAGDFMSLKHMRENYLTFLGKTVYSYLRRQFRRPGVAGCFFSGCLTGVGIGVGICSIIYGGYNYCKNKMNEKKALNAEPKLREELTKTIENTSTKAEIDEKPHQN